MKWRSSIACCIRTSSSIERHTTFSACSRCALRELCLDLTPSFTMCPAFGIIWLQVHKHLKLWKQLQVPELLGELDSRTAAAPAQARKNARALRSGMQGLLAVHRLVAGEPLAS